MLNYSLSLTLHIQPVCLQNISTTRTLVPDTFTTPRLIPTAPLVSLPLLSLWSIIHAVAWMTFLNYKSDPVTPQLKTFITFGVRPDVLTRAYTTLPATSCSDLSLLSTAQPHWPRFLSSAKLIPISDAACAAPSIWRLPLPKMLKGCLIIDILARMSPLLGLPQPPWFKPCHVRALLSLPYYPISSSLQHLVATILLFVSFLTLSPQDYDISSAILVLYCTPCLEQCEAHSKLSIDILETVGPKGDGVLP